MNRRKKQLLYFGDSDFSSGGAYVKDFSTYHNFQVDLSIDNSNNRTVNDDFFTTVSSSQYVIEPSGSYNNTLTNKIPRSGNGAYVFEGFDSIITQNQTYSNWVKQSINITDTGVDNGLGGTYRKCQRQSTGIDTRWFKSMSKPASADPYTITLPVYTGDIGSSDFIPVQIRGNTDAQGVDFCYQYSTDTFTLNSVSGGFVSVSAEAEVYDDKVVFNLSVITDAVSTALFIMLSARDTSGTVRATDTSATAYQNIGPVQLVQSDKFFPHAGETTGASIAIGATSVSCATSTLGFGATEGAMVLDINIGSDVTSLHYIAVMGSSFTDRSFLYFSGGAIIMRNIVGGVSAQQNVVTGLAAGSYKIAWGWNGTNMYAVVNGGGLVTLTIAAPFAPLTPFHLGSFSIDLTAPLNNLVRSHQTRDNWVTLDMQEATA